MVTLWVLPFLLEPGFAAAWILETVLVVGLMQWCVGTWIKGWTAFGPSYRRDSENLGVVLGPPGWEVKRDRRLGKSWVVVGMVAAVFVCHLPALGVECHFSSLEGHPLRELGLV